MIETWLLVITLFFPRLALLVAYFIGDIPPNNIPLIVDGLMWLLFPRVLMMLYIVMNLGFDWWLIVHFIAFVIAWLIKILKIASYE